MQALVVGHLGLVAGLDEGFISLDHKLGCASAQYRLLAEEVSLGLLGKGRIEHSAARAADAVGVCQRARVRGTRGILRYGYQAGHTPALLVLAAPQITRALG